MSADLGDLGARPSETGSRASAKPASGLVPTGFDPARWQVRPFRREDGAVRGWWVWFDNQPISGFFDERRDAVAAAREFRDEAIATEARRAETTGSVHEGAGRKASPNPNHIGETNDR